jgi:hypothetical protein
VPLRGGTHNQDPKSESTSAGIRIKVRAWHLGDSLGQPESPVGSCRHCQPQ